MYTGMYGQIDICLNNTCACVYEFIYSLMLLNEKKNSKIANWKKYSQNTYQAKKKKITV